MRSGHRGVIKRRTKRRLPIQELFGPSEAAVFDRTSGLADEVTRNLNEKLMRNLDYQIELILKKGPA